MTENNLPELSEYAFRGALVKAVEARGEDYVYEKVEGAGIACRYTKPGFGTGDLTVSCLIGDALSRLGVTVGQLYDCEGTGGDQAVSKFFAVSDALKKAAKAAQQAQDTGMTWGQALTTFDVTLMNEHRDDAIGEFVAPKPDPWASLTASVLDDPWTVPAPKSESIKFSKVVEAPLFKADSIWQADSVGTIKPLSTIQNYYNGAVKAAM